jgi:hypothetical protein
LATASGSCAIWFLRPARRRVQKAERCRSGMWACGHVVSLGYCSVACSSHTHVPTRAPERGVRVGASGGPDAAARHHRAPRESFLCLLCLRRHDQHTHVRAPNQLTRCCKTLTDFLSQPEPAFPWQGSYSTGHAAVHPWHRCPHQGALHTPSAAPPPPPPLPPPLPPPSLRLRLRRPGLLDRDPRHHHQRCSLRLHRVPSTHSAR